MSLNNKLVINLRLTISLAILAAGKVNTCEASSSTILPFSSCERTGKKLRSSATFSCRSLSVILPIALFSLKEFASLS